MMNKFRRFGYDNSVFPQEGQPIEIVVDDYITRGIFASDRADDRTVFFCRTDDDEVVEMDAELFRRYPGDGRLRGDVAAARQQWQTRIDASRSLARHGIGDVKKSLADTFADGRDAVAALLETKPLSPAERSEAAALLAIFGHDDLIDTALAGCDLGLVPQENGALLVTAALAAKRPDLMREVILTNLNRLRRELEPLAGFDRSRAYLRPTLIYKQIVAAWPILPDALRQAILAIARTAGKPTDARRWTWMHWR
jgi:hypothetical protein